MGAQCKLCFHMVYPISVESVDFSESVCSPKLAILN